MTIAIHGLSAEIAETSDWGNLEWEDIEEELYGSAREVSVGHIALAAWSSERDEWSRSGRLLKPWLSDRAVVRSTVGSDGPASLGFFDVHVKP